MSDKNQRRIEDLSGQLANLVNLSGLAPHPMSVLDVRMAVLTEMLLDDEESATFETRVLERLIDGIKAAQTEEARSKLLLPDPTAGDNVIAAPFPVAHPAHPAMRDMNN